MILSVSKQDSLCNPTAMKRRSTRAARGLE